MLEMNGLSAECQSTDGGVVVSSDPLQTNFLYEVNDFVVENTYNKEDGYTMIDQDIKYTPVWKVVGSKAWFSLFHPFMGR